MIQSVVEHPLRDTSQPLMPPPPLSLQVPTMTGARARALGAAGITRPDQLAVADEEQVGGWEG